MSARDALLERLRFDTAWPHKTIPSAVALKAADIIEEQEAESAELRAALEPFARMADHLAGAPDDKPMSNPRIHPPLFARDFYRARRVLAMPVEVRRGG